MERVRKKLKLIDLIKTESNSALLFLVAIGVISGLSNALLLVIINKATDNDSKGLDNTWLFFTCIVVIVLFLITKRFVLRRSLQLVQSVMLKIRIRIVDKIRRSELQMVEDLGRDQVYARITEDTYEISQTVSQLAGAFQSLIMVVFSILYVGFLSFPAFCIILVAVALGALTYIRTNKSIIRLFNDASKKEAGFFYSLNGILLGFKEMKINQFKNDNVFENYRKVTSDAIRLRLSAKFNMITTQIFSQSYFYLLLVIIIFILPAYHLLESASVFKISAAILFIIGPIEGVIKAIPNVIEANIAADNILSLEKKIERELSPDNFPGGDEKQEFEPMPLEKELVIKNMSFQYPVRNTFDGFSLGPVNLTIPKGQITYITGGNGAGKSTFLKLLCGLYYPQKGGIYVDDLLVSEHNYQNYREMFSIIFTDFFLFDRLFGLRVVDQVAVDEMLQTMRIHNKTRVVKGEITDLNLSTGQRKRLALAIAILEDKPVYVFDEVAADQDPAFKKFFYTELLRQLKAKGKTIIVVTHDDQYFDQADNLYKLEDGQVVQLNKGGGL